MTLRPKLTEERKLELLAEGLPPTWRGVWLNRLKRLVLLAVLLVCAPFLLLLAKIGDF